MQDAATVLDVIGKRGARGLPVERLYRQMFNPQLYLMAYGKLYANKGAMTPGVSGETVDGMSLAKIGAEKIHDGRFLRLIGHMLKAGYLEDWRWHATLSGSPQGGIASPVLSNIYLDRLDQYVEQRLLPEYNLGRRRRPNPAYQVVEYAIARARRHKDRAEARSLILRRRQLPSQDPADPDYRRLRYVRYADDWLLEYAGLARYYLLGKDVFRLGRLRWVMETSLLKTLAGKHRSTVSAMARKYKATVETPAGPRKCLQVVIKRDRGRKPLVTRFGGIPLRRARTAVLTDQRPVMASTRRNELILRLLAGRCEICEDTAGLEVHHVRKLADLVKPGRRDKPEWMHLMAMRRRKTLITCRRCHEDIHAGRATRPYPK